MKRIIIVIIGMVLSMTTYSQNKDPLHLFDSTQKSATFDSVYRDVKGALVTMADGLKVTADHLYGVLVYEQRIQAIIWLIVAFISIFPIKGFLKYYRKDISDDYGNLNKDGWLMVALAIISVGVIVGVCCNIDTIINGLLNPEYGALKEIMSHI